MKMNMKDMKGYDYHIEYNERITDRKQIYHEDNNLVQKEHLHI